MANERNSNVLPRRDVCGVQQAVVDAVDLPKAKRHILLEPEVPEEPEEVLDPADLHIAPSDRRPESFTNEAANEQLAEWMSYNVRVPGPSIDQNGARQPLAELKERRKFLKASCNHVRHGLHMCALRAQKYERERPSSSRR